MTHFDFGQIEKWIVSAWWPEQEALAMHLTRGRSLQRLSDSLRVAGPYAFLTTGIGSPRAAMSVAAALTAAGHAGSITRSVFFVATAGAYDGNVPLDSAFVVNGAVWSDGDLVNGRSYLPQASGGEYLQATLAAASDSDEKKCLALSSPGITLDADLAQTLSSLAQLENLEVYGVGLACQSLGVRWGACLGVSNSVGSLAHAQWKKHHLTASRAAQELLIKRFAGDFAE